MLLRSLHAIGLDPPAVAPDLLGLLVGIGHTRLEEVTKVPRPRFDTGLTGRVDVYVFQPNGDI